MLVVETLNFSPLAFSTEICVAFQYGYYRLRRRRIQSRARLDGYAGRIRRKQIILCRGTVQSVFYAGSVFTPGSHWTRHAPSF